MFENYRRILTAIRAICYGDDIIDKDRTWTQLLKTVQCFAENTPQVILQLYVTIVTFDPPSAGKTGSVRIGLALPPKIAYKIILDL